MTINKILIIDDEPAMLEILKDAVEGLGFSAITLENTKNAFNIIDDGEVTAVLSDISMPGESGLELLKKVRAAKINIPFVFLTAFDSKENISQAKFLGVTDFLEKPCEWNRLREVIRKLLKSTSSVAS